jgi:putative component of membrane protein insertase Oxa1/YidC/SpoIIIJ protein YidD
MTDKEIIKAFYKSRKSEVCKAVIRPKFTMYKELFQTVAALAILIAVILLHSFFVGTIFAVLLCAAIVLLLCQTKSILLLMIFAYQRFAPKLLRAACLFQPSCSEYMKQSIMKYGVFKGVKKGFKRIKRCRPPNGGLDEP